jgi:hypothetical protein
MQRPIKFQKVRISTGHVYAYMIHRIYAILNFEFRKTRLESDRGLTGDEQRIH